MTRIRERFAQGINAVKPKRRLKPPALLPEATNLAAMMPEPQWLGWRIGTFALDCLAPAIGLKTSSVEVWRAYLKWCREGKCVPLAMGVFQSRFDQLAEEVGIGRFQNGAHVFYRDLALKGA